AVHDPALGLRENGMLTRDLVVSEASRSPICPEIAISPRSEPQSSNVCDALTETGGNINACMSDILSAALLGRGLIIQREPKNKASTTIEQEITSHLPF